MVAAIVRRGRSCLCLKGFMADRTGIQHAFIIPVLCYVFIAGFGFCGAQPDDLERASDCVEGLGRRPSSRIC